LRKDWLCIIETGFNPDDSFRPHKREQTKDLSLKELPQFLKSPDMKSIKGMPQTQRMLRLRERLEQLCRPVASLSIREIPHIGEVPDLNDEDINILLRDQ